MFLFYVPAKSNLKRHYHLATVTTLLPLEWTPGGISGNHLIRHPVGSCMSVSF